MRRARVVVVIAMISLVSVLGAAEGWAAHSCPPTHKLGRGLANLFFGFVEVPRTMIEVGKHHGQIAGATWGLAEGLCRTVARMGVGLLEIVTFPTPFPKSDYGEPIMKPEFPGGKY